MGAVSWTLCVCECGRGSGGSIIVGFIVNRLDKVIFIIIFVIFIFIFICVIDSTDTKMNFGVTFGVKIVIFVILVNITVIMMNFKSLFQ